MKVYLSVRMLNYRILSFIVLLAINMLSACDNSSPFPRCVSADNFSYDESIVINAHFSNDSAFQDNHGNRAGSDEKQVVRWTKTKFVTDDSKLLVVRPVGMWTSWDKDNSKYIANAPTPVEDKYEDIYGSILDVNRLCNYQKMQIKEGKKSQTCNVIKDSDDKNFGSYGAPCWLSNGYGAYLLFQCEGETDPNDNPSIMANPQSAVIRLGHLSAKEGGSNEVEYDGMTNSQGDQVELRAGCRIYAKILDTYYYDNAGGYGIEFISGVKLDSGKKVFEPIRKLVASQLDAAAEKSFKKIVNDSSFKKFVFALIILFIMISALSYILGIVQSTSAEIFERILKITLILLLISPNSWNFFHTHLLALFRNGTDQIIAIINNNSDLDQPFAFLDEMILEKIFSSVVWNVKMRALIITDFSAVFAIFLLIFVLLTYVFLCCYAFVMYLTSLIGISLLIMLMPIIMLSILFSQLKHLFDSWISQIIAFCLQAILIFSLIALFSNIIMSHYYRMFGFTACFNDWLEVKLCLVEGFCILDTKVKSWTPGQKYISKKIIIALNRGEIDLKDSYNGSSRFTFTGGASIIKIPPEYKNEGFRYIDYPYLDPGIDFKNDGSPKAALSILRRSLISLDKSDKTSISRDIDSAISLLDDMCNSVICNKWKLNDFMDSLFYQLIREWIKNNPGKTLEEFLGYVMKAIPGISSYMKYKIVSSLLLGEYMESRSMLINYLDSLDLDKLDHATDAEGEDAKIIEDISRGYLFIWSEFFGLLLATFLIWHLRQYVQTLGASISGGNAMSKVMGDAYNAAVHYGGGFSLAIFSKIPFIGSVVRGPDILMNYYKNTVGAAIDKVSLKSLKGRLPIIGNSISFLSDTARDLVTDVNSPESDVDESYKKSTVKYVKHMTGYALKFFSPKSLAQYTAKHYLGKLTGDEEMGLLKRMREDFKGSADKIKDFTLESETRKPSKILDDGNEEGMFSRSDPVQLNDLLDDKGELNIGLHNINVALEEQERLSSEIQQLEKNTSGNIVDLDSKRKYLKILNEKLKSIDNQENPGVVRRKSTTDTDNIE